MAINALINLSDADAGWGTISYGGYTFPGLRDVKLSFEDVYDGSGRVVVVTRGLLRVHFFSQHTDANAHITSLLGLRRMLSEPGQGLVISGHGWGDLTINGSDTNQLARQDAEWGPKPRVLELNQIGGFATECIWECAFSIKEGSTAQGNFKAFNYTIDFDIDEAGLATRTIAGYLEVKLTRTAGGRTYARSVDTFANQIRVGVPFGFQRGPRRRHISEDRSRLDFMFVDSQLPGDPPPAHALRCDLNYEIESVPPGFARFNATLAGSIEVPSGTPPVKGAEAFMRVFLDKQQKLSAAVSGEGVAFPTRIRFGRAIGSRRSEFAVSWMVTGCLDDLLKQGGIWEPVSGVNWPEWAESMANAWANGGTAQLAYNASEDVLIDLNYLGGLPAIGTGGNALSANASGSSKFSCANIPEKQTWLFYENSVRAYREHNAVTHKIAEPYNPGPMIATNPATGEGVEMAKQISGSMSSFTQYQSRPYDLILMHGKTMRINKQPKIPRLVAIGGRAVQEMKVVTDGPKVIGCIFGCKVYVARWAILYRLVNGYLGKIEEQKNPALCCAD